MSKLLKAAFSISSFRFIGMGLSFLSTAIISWYYGLGSERDAWIANLNVLNFFFGFITVVWPDSFVPIFIKIRNEEGEDNGWKFFSAVFWWLLIAFLMAGILNFVLSSYVIELFAPGFGNQTVNLAKVLMLICLPSMALSQMFIFLTRTLNCINRFGIPELVNLILPLTTIIGLLLWGKTVGIYVLAWTFAVGNLASFAILMTLARRYGIKLTLSFSVQKKNLVLLLQQAAVPLSGIVLSQGLIYVNSSLASKLTQGSLSALMMGKQLFNVPLTMLVLALGSIIFPLFSNQVAQKDWSGLEKSIYKATSYVLVFGIPISLWMILGREPFIKLFFEHGAFDRQATELAKTTTLGYSFFITIYGLYAIYARALLAMRKIKFLILNGAITVSLSIVSVFLLEHYFGLIGIILGGEIPQLVSAILMYNEINKTLGSNTKEVIYRLFKQVIVANVAMVLMIVLGLMAVQFFLGVMDSLYLSVSEILVILIVGGGSYFFICNRFKIQEVQSVSSIFFNRNLFVAKNDAR